MRIDERRFKTVDRHRVCAGLDCKTGVVGQRRGHLRGFIQNLFQLRDLGLHQLVNLCDFLGGHGVFFQERIHIKAIPLFAGNAPGRCVRLFEIAHIFKLRHLIADGSRRAAQLLTFGEVFGADRLPAPDVLFHNGFQNLLFTGAEPVLFLCHAKTSFEF